MYDIIIIGAGIAGLTSSIYGARAGKKVLVIDELNYGGQIINSNDVENYPGFSKISGFDLMTNIYNQAKSFNVEFKSEKVIKITNDKKVITENNEYITKSVIIATGLVNKELNISNEKELIGKGISYCATCDGNFFRGKDVAVVGGGNTAIEDAIYLSNICNKVHLIHRRDSFRADKVLIDSLKDNVIIHYNSEVKELVGSNFLEKIILSNNEELNISALFIAIGKLPNNNIFKEIINLNEEGYIVSNEECKTSKDFIFVAGDCRDKKVRQLVTAAGDGAIAAHFALEYLEKEN